MAEKNEGPVQGKDSEAAKRDIRAGATNEPTGKGLSAHENPDVDGFKAPNQQRQKTDGLTSQQNIGRNADLGYSDEVGLNKHPELRDKTTNAGGTQLSGGTQENPEARTSEEEE